MSRYFLVDFENVSDDGLAGFQKLKPTDTVMVLYTDKACKIRMDFVETLITSKRRAELRLMKVASGNQALDMQLATFLGSMIPGEDRATEFVIVSKDKGYNHIIQFWKNREPGRKISLKKSIQEALKATDEEETVPETPAKPAEKKAEPKPEPKTEGQEKTRLNAAIQHILSEAKYDTAIIAFVASCAVKLYGQENAKRSTYTGIIKQYGQKEGLQIYNLIKKEL